MRDAAIKPFPVDVTEIMEICQELLGIVFELGFFKRIILQLMNGLMTLQSQSG